MNSLVPGSLYSVSIQILKWHVWLHGLDSCTSALVCDGLKKCFFGDILVTCAASVDTQVPVYLVSRILFVTSPHE
jgi:hypothetical protein